MVGMSPDFRSTRHWLLTICSYSVNCSLGQRLLMCKAVARYYLLNYSQYNPLNPSQNQVITVTAIASSAAVVGDLVAGQFAQTMPAGDSHTPANTTGHYMDFHTRPQAKPEAIVSGPNYRFTILSDRLIRYEWAHDGQFEDRASTFAINRQFEIPDFSVVDGELELEIITDHFHLIYDKKRFSPAGFVVNFGFRHTLWGAPWRYGEVEELNLGGTARTLDLCDGRCDMGPGVISKAGYASLDDSSSMLFDGGFVAGRRPGDRVDGYLFCYGHDYKAAIKAFYELSGKQPKLPRYSLGNWWSRYYAYHQDEYIQLMDEFRTRDIPLSVAVVDMDWHLVSDKRVPHSGWGGYTWDDKLFPDPKRFRRALHERNLKVTLNDHPHNGVHSHEDSYDEMALALDIDTRDRKPILFDPANAAFMKAYLEILHRNIEKVACDFWWIDWQQGSYSKLPGLDPLWLLNHFHYLDNGRDKKTIPLIFSRYAGPGSHRYPVGFSGDTVVTWASLAFQPEFTATASNVGYGWWSHDIGGHIFGGRDDELVTRWVQLGVFSPIFRLHSSDSKWNSKEPWLYRSECGKVMSEFMRLRHRMVPFLYTQNVLGSEQDEPLVQPMYWSHPDMEAAYEFQNQYTFGPSLLVAPIVQPRNPVTNLAAVKAWLPAGKRYVDVFTGTVYDGDREIVFYRRLSEYPVLAPEGSITVLDEAAAPANGCANPDAFEAIVVIGQDAKSSNIESVADDDDTNARLPSSSTTCQREMVLRFDQATGTLIAELNDARSWNFTFLSLGSIPSDIRISDDGVDITPTATVTLKPLFESQTQSLRISCSFPTSTPAKHTLTITLGPDPQLGIVDPRPRLEQMIMDFQIDFAIKDRLWDAIKKMREKGLSSCLGTLMAFGLKEGIVEPVLEMLVADRRLFLSA
ncbi:putative alpha-xylosidase [Aureobasidium pullulans]|nr:putative alpha-xylosidase [Aureobasidium pullulans]